jgi:photosystem II stability/assembly factor-like uncharacterized protein
VLSASSCSIVFAAERALWLRKPRPGPVRTGYERNSIMQHAFGLRQATPPRRAVLLLTIVLALSVAVPASARTWSTESLPSLLGSLNGISCLATSGGGHCVAVGQNITGTGPVVVVSNDGGKTWNAEDLPGGVAGLFTVSCSSVSRCWAAGEQDTSGNHAAVIATRDGGQSWQRETTPGLPGGFPTPALEKISCVGQRCLATGIRLGFILLTTDGGAHWSVKGLPQGCKGFCPAYTADAVVLTSSSVGYAGGGNQCGGFRVTQCPGIIWKTTNGGGGWKVVFKSAPFVDAISCVDPSHCWAAVATFSTGEVFGSANGGKSWRRQTLPHFGGYFNDISCMRTAHDRCFAVGENKGRTAPLIAETSDGGYNWKLDHSPTGTGPLYGVSMLGTGARAVGQDSKRTEARALSS